MGFGALSLLTPCVFPMVPITVSYFTSHAAGHRTAAVRDALIYALGIIFTFTALGVALALIFGAAGINKLAASPWVNILITAIFLSFALSLFGAFNLQVPSSILTKLDALSRREEGTAGGAGHIIALLLMGLTFSLTSFTCTAAFVGTLLVMAAQGSWLYPVVGMLAFSSVFALPFFVLALAPQLLSQLPKAGGWLNSVKVVMGLLEVAAAMKFISNVDLIWGWGIFTREVVLASWVAVALLITIYLLGKFQLTHDTQTERIGAVRLLIALVSLSLGFYLSTGLFGARLGELESFLPPATVNTRSASFAGGSDNGELPWILNDYQGALARAREENKLVLIDFTGYTCTNCRWMEANMFPKEQVKRELDKYVRVRLYTDGEGEIYEQQQRMQEQMFGTVALPFYAVVDANGKAVASFPGLTRNPSEFVAFLNSGHPSGVQTAQVTLR
jgi:thiol:disulfide interchange protein DsbD